MTEVEQKKSDAIAKLTAKGRTNGILTYKEIMDSLSEIEMEPEQIEHIYEVLEHEGIEVVSDLDKEMELSLIHILCAVSSDPM